MRAAIVLAGGRSERFGRADKLFATLGGRPLLLHAILAARAAPVRRVIVVARRAGRVREMVRRAGVGAVCVVRLAARDAPLSASLAAGVAALRPIERDAFIFLGDMPAVDPGMAARLVRRRRAGTSLVRPRHRGVPGHPVLACMVRTLGLGLGDAGFRIPRSRVAWVENGPGCIADVDSPAALARARRRRGQG